ncbi:DNA replication/repair protein RecF [Candidatus Daviesbacteria bacterium]|nr:DNA replication/repair protein RecF [Candidatus Daviesbacteria bacterium]
MFLKSIKLKNFRNYHVLDHSFTTPTTILIGDNAQGKSNFLESIYFLATAQSPKAERDGELIRYGEDVLRVEGVVENSEQLGKTQRISDSEIQINRNSDLQSSSESFRTNLTITMQLVDGRLKKRVEINGISRRVSDYSENLAVVAFAPEDINLVTGSPSLRRDHIDQVISQIDRGYKKIISSYEHILTRKNRVLKAIKDGFGKIDELQFWCEQQIILGAQVTDKRKKFFEYINSTEKKFGGFRYDYLPSPVTQTRLGEYQEREIESTVSLIGPHRDDFSFVILSDSEGSLANARTSNKLRDSSAAPQNDNTRDLSKFGSRGEQRTAVLDLKIAEVSFMEQKIGSRPVLLLDDIFSELDLEHKKHVVELAKLQQTIITTVELDKYLHGQFQEAEVLKVEEGKIKRFTP